MTQTTLFDGQTFDAYPMAQAHSPTSRAAAEAIEPSAATLRGKVLAYIRESGGCTDEEGIEASGIPASTYRPRRVELWRAGLIVDCGATRETRSGRKAVVWKAV